MQESMFTLTASVAVTACVCRPKVDPLSPPAAFSLAAFLRRAADFFSCSGHITNNSHLASLSACMHCVRVCVCVCVCLFFALISPHLAWLMYLCVFWSGDFGWFVCSAYWYLLRDRSPCPWVCSISVNTTNLNWSAIKPNQLIRCHSQQGFYCFDEELSIAWCGFHQIALLNWQKNNLKGRYNPPPPPRTEESGNRQSWQVQISRSR